MENKTKYRFNTDGNLALLRYCATVFKDGWLAMDYAGNWLYFKTKPWLAEAGYVWKVSNNYYKYTGFMIKLPKRRGSFYKHSLIRIKKDLAWFEEQPDVFETSINIKELV